MYYTLSIQIWRALIFGFILVGYVYNLTAQSDSSADSSFIKVQGNIHTHYDESMVPEVEVYSVVRSGDSSMRMTNEEGYFSFELPKGSHVNIRPAKNTNPLRNVNVGDIVNIQRHILDIEEITNPFDLLAADVNNDGIINTKDMLEIREVILRRKSSFSNNTSWRFFSDLTGEEIIVFDYLFDPVRADFTAVKVGNVNKIEEITLLSRSSNAHIDINDLVIEPNGTHRVSIPIAKYTGTQGLIKFNPVNTTIRIKNLDNSHWSASENGHLHFITENNIPQLELEITSKRPALLSKLINFTQLLGYKDSELLPMDISFTSRMPLQELISHPTQNSILFNLDLIEDSPVHIQIFDILGRSFISKKMDLPEGTHEISLELESLPHSGVYFYHINSNQFKTTKRILVQK